ncbi:hypothetical protein BDW59DRAFT_143589 [Aspergillus cavernicola]|uniref:Polyketide synthase n=1 Tax=Aspergillus cavernicola TaxID=176166 RepID=A0ABR4IJK9_9EURO
MMKRTEGSSQSGQTLLVFGSQSLTFDKRALTKLRNDIDSSSQRSWIQETISTLPTYWTALSNALPESTGKLPPQELLQDLDRLLNHPIDALPDQLNLPNIILTPFVVLGHLTEYERYLATTHENDDAQSPCYEVDKNTSAIGFCTGLLSTFAVASSHSIDDLARYGAVAVRLAMLVGALVDAEESRQEDLGNDRSTSYSVAWTTAEQEAKMRDILTRRHPEVYIAVQYDRSRATLTSSGRAAATVAQELRAAGLTAAEVSLQGRFHDPCDVRKTDTDTLVDLCDRMVDLQLATTPAMVLASYSNSTGGSPTAEGTPLHELAVRSILVQHCDWYGTFSAAYPAFVGSRVVCFGSEKSIPPTMASQVQPVYQAMVGRGTPSKSVAQEPQDFSGLDESDMIAVVGMGIKVAGADDLDEFAEMLRTGKSQHQEVKSDIDFDTPWREDPGSRTWYYNAVKDRHAFDHSFFKMSPREAAAMDPQHRLFLLAAYQAVEQSGYFAQPAGSEPKLPEESVGAFVGISTTDYDQHVSCHDSSAYTATGNLRSFLAGRVSHQFGWTGPSMTIDTACSSSAVAVHLACKALLARECSSAIAGGVAVHSSPFWFQNLGAASFLSPTGQCKPFDEKGDGYCRAEGIGCVMLKRMSDARAQGDQILGCIAASAVHQNQNCTALVVPNKPSLSSLFKQVVRKSGLVPGDISLVEAHGTGTAVGDPAEYASISNALDVPARSKPVFLGSVKGHVGHTEAAAGIVSLIKVLVMMNEGFIPPQASHSRLSPRIADATDKMHISTVLRAWDAPRKAALVNSYGASGSNTSMVLLQSPKGPSTPIQEGVSLPFWITGTDDREIAAYCARLSEYIGARPSLRLADIASNLSRQAGRTLRRQLIFSCRSIPELKTILSRGASSAEDASQAARPVILCFGGQVSTFVGLNRAVYDQVDILRYHLDECDSAMTALGLDSIYPEIFSCDPIADTVKLQSMLFAMQYSCAKAWMECGIPNSKIAAVVGHSFGELVALCISGVLSVQDTIKLVAGRARLIRDQWGSDRGAMAAVEADESVIQELLEEAAQQTPDEPHPASVACYNGPRSFTLAGSTAAIQGVLQIIAAKYPSLRHKKLNVTNSFHCSLADSIVEPLTKLAEELTFNSPVIHIEHASPTPSTGARLSSSFAANHLRNPVYFNHAVQRLAQSYPDSIWIEAGSNSTITTMASRALRSASGSSTPIGPQSRQYFQAVNITGARGSLDSLTETTQCLWKEGLAVSFWQHHSLQMDRYNHLILPPRQFAKSIHGLAITAPKGGSGASKGAAIQPENGLWSFVGYEDSNGSFHAQDKHNRARPRFQINTESEKYQAMVAGHIMARTAAICPAGLEVDMAIEALFSLHPEWKEQRLQPMSLDMVNSAPVCLDPTRAFWLQLGATDDSRKIWDWSIISTHNGGTATLLHVKGVLHFRSTDDAAYRAEFGRLERIVRHKQCTDLLDLANADVPEDEVHVLQGRNVYQGFSDVIQYTDLYRSLKRLVGSGFQSAGTVRRKRTQDTWLDVPLSECFMQTGGIWVSCMTDRSPDDVFIATGCELWMRSPTVAAKEAEDEGPEIWHVLARHTRVSERLYVSDVFVFDSRTGALTEVIMGTKFSRLPKMVMRKILNEFTDPATTPAAAPVREREHVQPRQIAAAAPAKTKAAQPDISNQVRQLLSSVSGIEPEKIKRDAELADIGVDSLMSMELAREIEGVFKFSPDHSELLEASTMDKLTIFISHSLNPSSAVSLDGENHASSSSSDSSDAGDTIPSTPTRVSSTDNFQEPFIISTPRDGPGVVVLPEGEHFSQLKKPVFNFTKTPPKRNIVEQEELAEQYIARYTAGFTPPTSTPIDHASQTATGAVVIITGGTGSLGSYLVAGFARDPSVRTVVCLNRPSKVPGVVRQREALSSRTLTLTAAEDEKLRFLDGSTADPKLGLSSEDYTWLAQNATHIVHNAWPMSLRRPIHTFVPQFQALRNLLDLAREMASVPRSGSRIGFQFVSSISVVGSAPQQRVLEQRVPLSTTLPLGYPEAKWVCERMIDETLHRYPEHFRPMVVRPGQITGSNSRAFWTTQEHMPFLIKSSQSLGAFPDLDGPLHWIPVDTVAQTMIDVLLPEVNDSGREPDAYPVYHLDNPVGQPWKEMSKILTSALGIPSDRIIPFQEWLELLRSSPLNAERDIPAAKILEFFTDDFLHMACGGLVLDTRLSEEHSRAMAAQGPVSAELATRYVQSWKDMGFLKP